MAGRLPDWRDPDAYAGLIAADRSVIAWEALRRNPAYCDAALTRTASAQAWGLVRWSCPEAPFFSARPLWRVQDHPLVLVADACDKETVAADRAGIATWAGAAASHDVNDVTHLLFTDGCRTLRIDVCGLRDGEPPALCYRIAGQASAIPQVLALRRWLHFAASGRFGASLYPAEPRARRWITLLRASDGVAAGASQREIAKMLLGPISDRGWRDADPALRSRAQRIVRDARRFVDHGWRWLLRSPATSRTASGIRR